MKMTLDCNPRLRERSPGIEGHTSSTNEKTEWVATGPATGPAHRPDMPACYRTPAAKRLR